MSFKLSISEFLCNVKVKYHGFDHVIMVVGYIAPFLMAYFGDGQKWGLHISFSEEQQPLGTIGGVAQISGLDKTFLVMNADVLTTLNYLELVRYHKKKKATLLLPCMNASRRSS